MLETLKRKTDDHFCYRVCKISKSVCQFIFSFIFKTCLISLCFLFAKHLITWQKNIYSILCSCLQKIKGRCTKESSLLSLNFRKNHCKIQQISWIRYGLTVEKYLLCVWPKISSTLSAIKKLDNFTIEIRIQIQYLQVFNKKKTIESK